MVQQRVNAIAIELQSGQCSSLLYDHGTHCHKHLVVTSLPVYQNHPFSPVTVRECRNHPKTTATSLT